MKRRSEKLTSEPAAAQLMRLLLGLAIQKVEVALQRGREGEKRLWLLAFTQMVWNSEEVVNKDRKNTASQKTVTVTEGRVLHAENAGRFL